MKESGRYYVTAGQMIKISLWAGITIALGMAMYDVISAVADVLYAYSFGL